LAQQKTLQTVMADLRKEGSTFNYASENFKYM
jgi:hypothetical protein